jgi:hypothetical protein
MGDAIAQMRRRRLHRGFWCERPRRRWEDNIKMDVRCIKEGGMYWTDLAEDRDQWRALVDRTHFFLVPLTVKKFLNWCANGSF